MIYKKVPTLTTKSFYQTKNLPKHSLNLRIEPSPVYLGLGQWVQDFKPETWFLLSTQNKLFHLYNFTNSFDPAPIHSDSNSFSQFYCWSFFYIYQYDVAIAILRWLTLLITNMTSGKRVLRTGIRGHRYLGVLHRGAVNTFWGSHTPACNRHLESVCLLLMYLCLLAPLHLR